jgi:hypothetical protein
MIQRMSAWERWRRFAERAAEAQAHVLFFLLYFLAIVPMGLLRLGSANDELRQRPPGEGPRWRHRESSRADLTSARRQF